MSATFKVALFSFSAFAISTLGAADAGAREFKVSSASLAFDQRSGQPVVNFRFTPDSARDFAGFTEANVGRKIDIRVDGKVMMQPVIREPIRGGSGQVIVSSAEEGRTLAARLSDGSLTLEIDVAAD
jgi:preprotein translocase subunit SecD